tara:strand:+ start:737 stop:1054 length:318 start_codon:yes stop_codon:yes gene_type:complete
MFKGFQKLNKKVNILENNVRRIIRDIDGADDQVDNMVQPGVVDNTVSSNVITNTVGGFTPGTGNVSRSMFGESIPGSFDRKMGNMSFDISPLNKNKNKKIDNEKI